MSDRRNFLGLSARAGVAATVAVTVLPESVGANPPRAPTRVYDGILGRGYARGPHGLVHFQDAGGLVQPRRGELPLVLLHQSPSSTRQFEAAFKPLVARGIRFIAIDTPGFGFSDPTPTLPRLEDWAPSIVAVLDHFGIAQADVLGHHTGALVATEVALQHPTRVRRLILNGPFPITETERAQYIEAGDRRHIEDAPTIDGKPWRRIGPCSNCRPTMPWPGG